MTVEEEGQRIAEQLGRGFNYVGPQYEEGNFAFHWIGDPVTGTTFAATSLEGAKRRIAEVRKSFSAEPWSPYKVDRRKTMVEKRGISPAVAIALIPIGLGLGAIGILALVALAREPGPPEPPPGLANLYGFITDAETGEGIPGVDMTVYQDYDTETAIYHATTDWQGYYQILDMIPDVIALMVVYANGYETYTNEHIPIVEGNNELSFSMEVAG